MLIDSINNLKFMKPRSYIVYVWNTDTSVSDLDFNLVFWLEKSIATNWHQRNSNLNFSTLCVFDCIADNVHQNLPKFHLILFNYGRNFIFNS